MDNHKTPTTPARGPGSETLHHSAGAPVVLAGATGDLGSRVAAELRALGASVRALVRPGIAAEKQTSFHLQILKRCLEAREKGVRQ
jgi:nucleoside-diphosphate-sugar epimerase